MSMNHPITTQSNNNSNKNNTLLVSSSVPQKRRRRVILEEDEYQANLSEIIQRDYFPDVEDLQLQVALQERRQAGDFLGAIQLRKQARQKQQKQQEEEQNDKVPSALVPLHRESLSGFHARATSEDNHSFDQSTQQQQQQQQQQQLIEERQALPPSNNFRSSTYAASPLPLASDAFNPTPHRLPMAAWTKQPSNPLFYVPQAIQQKKDESSQFDNETSSTMPPPSRQQSADSLVVSSSSSSEKRIEPSATRFSRAIQTRPPSLAAEWDTSSTATTTTTDDDLSTDLDAPPRHSLTTERHQARQRKLRQVNTLVSMTPVILPGASPLVTWGSVDDTPLVVSGHHDDNNSDTHSDSVASYQIPHISVREAAADQAQARSQERSQRAKAANKQRTTKDAQRRLLSVSPKLMSKKRPLSSRSAQSFGSALRASYLATPISKRKGSSAHRQKTPRDTAYRVTPLRPAKLS